MDSKSYFTVLGGNVSLSEASPRPTEDALWLASAIQAQEGEHILDMGCGSGVVSLCLNWRIKELHITGLEVQEDLISIAEANAKLNNCTHFDIRQSDVLTWQTEEKFDHTISNPPFHNSEKGFETPKASKEIAHGTTKANALKWFNKMQESTKESGTITLIHHTQFEKDLCSNMAGHIKVIHLISSPNKPGKRIIIQNTPCGEAKVEKYTLKTYDKKIRHAILERGESLWDYVEKN